MHHEHDLDLIDALAEGRLDDAGPARELVDSCAECADYYAARLTISAAVAEEQPPQLNDLERARLHGALWEELEASSQANVSTPSPSGGGTPWWYRLAPVAAVLVVAVGIGSMLGGDSTEDGGEMRTAAESTEAGDQDGAGADSATEMAPLAEPEGDDADESADGSTDDTVAADSQEETDATESSEGDFTAALSDSLAMFREQVASGEVDAVDEEFDCEAPADAGDLVAAERRTVADEELWLAAYRDPNGTTSAAAFRPSDCDMVDHDR